MENDWTNVSLGEVVDLLTGFPFKSQRYTENASDPRLLRGDNVAQGWLRWDGVKRWPRELLADLDAYWLQEGDVILAMDRPWIEAGLKYAVVQSADIPCVLVQRVARLRGLKSIETAFLRYVIGSRSFTNHVLAVQTGTSIPHISPTQIKEFTFWLPPPDDQRAIAGILGALDEKIELNRRMNDTLEEIARALFKSWFIDFDPVRAKTAGRIPAGIDDAIAVLFPHVLSKDEIPQGWQRAGLGSWADALSGGTPSKSQSSLWEGAIPWISPKVMTQLHADEAEAHVAESAIGNGTRLAPAGATLVMVRGMGLHEKVRISQARRAVTFNQDVKALVPRGIEPNLLLFALLHGQEELLGKVESSGHGTGKLPTEILLGYQITMPPREVQSELTKIFDDFNNRIAVTREESRTLAALRDLLLPKLLSGELRIRDAEREVGKVA